MLKRPNIRSERGQSLVLMVLALPLLLLVTGLVIDGAHAFAEKRRTQNTADAAALAAAQQIGGTLTSNCPGSGMISTVQTAAECYSAANDGPVSLPTCVDADPANPTRPAPGTGCYAYPYVDKNGVPHDDKVEVRITRPVKGFFLKAIGLGSVFDNGAYAHAVASVASETHCYIDGQQRDDLLPDCELPGQQGTFQPGADAHCLFDPAVDNPDQYLTTDPPCAKPGQTGTLDPGTQSHCEFDPPIDNPDQYLNTDPPCTAPGHWEGGVDGAQAFAMSRACDALLYTGTPKTGKDEPATFGAVATNGGLTFKGTRNKRVNTLAFDKPRCGDVLPQPPNGDPAACDATPLSGAGAQSCVRNFIDFSDRIPLNWPIPPPPLPTPLPAGTTWDPTSDYPDRCVLLTPPPGSTTVTLAAVPGPPGIYCVSGSDVTLVITTSMTAGDGYTFFGLDGARIQIASNGTSVKFYWPSGCGDRPTTRTLSFTCFGRNIVGYDPMTVLYSTSGTWTNSLPPTCTDSAICFNGQGGSLIGDVFAPMPNDFPPSLDPLEYGATVWVAGGAASAGDGFIQAWQVVVQGNSATYTGTGPLVGSTFVPGPQGTFVPGPDAQCIFDPPVSDPKQYLTTDPPCSVPGQQGTLDPGTGSHCLFDPPVPDPDQYLTTDPPCLAPGESGTVVTSPGDISMDQ